MAAPLVIPSGFVELASGYVSDATLTTAQTVFTNQLGVQCVPMFVVFRGASATVNAATTVSVGNSASATAYYNASAILQSMLTTTGLLILPLYGSSVGTAVAAMKSGTIFKVTYGGTLTSNGNISVDVLGYYFLS